MDFTSDGDSVHSLTDFHVNDVTSGIEIIEG